MKHINRNSGILIDSDRTCEGGDLGEQSALLVDEADRIDLDRWVLERREIENYFRADAIEDVLEVSELIYIGHYDEAEDILEDYNYDVGKVQNAREIAQVMCEIGVDDEFSDLKSIVEEAFDGV